MTNQGKAYLEYRLGDKFVKDSAMIQKGVFQFNWMMSDPVYAQLTVDHQINDAHTGGYDILTFNLEKGITNIMAHDSIKMDTISGSQINADNREYQAAILAPQEIMMTLSNQYQRAPDEQKKDQKFMDGLNAKFDTAYNEKKSYSSNIHQTTSQFLFGPYYTK